MGLALFVSSGCESQLCKTAKEQEALAVLESEAAQQNLAKTRNNKESAKARFNQFCKEKGINCSHVDFDESHQANYEKLLFRSVQASSRKSEASGLRVKACK